jgi:hypothetical protein
MQIWLIIVVLMLLFGVSTVLKAIGAAVLLFLMAPAVLILVIVFVLLFSD